MNILVSSLFLNFFSTSKQLNPSTSLNALHRSQRSRID
jgi:hypothetical protein